MKRSILFAALISISLFSAGTASAGVSLSIGKASDLNSKAGRKAIAKLERSYIGRYSGTVKFVPGNLLLMMCPIATPSSVEKVKIAFSVTKLRVDEKTSKLTLDITNHDPLSVNKKLAAIINDDGSFEFRDVEFAGTGYAFYEFFKNYLVKPKGSRANAKYAVGHVLSPHFVIDEFAANFESSCTSSGYTGVIKRSKLRKAAQ